MKRVTGLGGIFFKCKDTAKTSEWYKKHLGFNLEDWGGSVFNWVDENDPKIKGTTVWSPFKDDTEYFKPSDKQFMFNYRVDDLEALLKVLREEGVQIVGEIQEESYGKFGWIMDPEGNKIELWEPKDDGF